MKISTRQINYEIERIFMKTINNNNNRNYCHRSMYF